MTYRVRGIVPRSYEVTLSDTDLGYLFVSQIMWVHDFQIRCINIVRRVFCVTYYFLYFEIAKRYSTYDLLILDFFNKGDV